MIHRPMTLRERMRGGRMCSSSDAASVRDTPDQPALPLQRKSGLHVCVYLNLVPVMSMFASIYLSIHLFTHSSIDSCVPLNKRSLRTHRRTHTRTRAHTHTHTHTCTSTQSAKRLQCTVKGHWLHIGMEWQRGAGRWPIWLVRSLHKAFKQGLLNKGSLPRALKQGLLAKRPDTAERKLAQQ